MRALIDGDILRYEVGFGAETAWRSIFPAYPESIPTFDFVKEILHEKIDNIVALSGADSYQLYLTKGRCFRDAIATVKPYKPRVENKPWHFNNLTVYMRDVLNAVVVEGIEADDAMAIEHVSSSGSTIIASRDKDLRQLPGWFYSWELGSQVSFGPINIDLVGSLALSDNRKKLIGTGFAFFCAQVLMGDKTDNIPGLPGWGPVKVYEYLLGLKEADDYLYYLTMAYQDYYNTAWEERLLEQGQLAWMVRRINGKEPELWQIGMTS